MRRAKLNSRKPIAADPVVTRLLLDLQLARRVQKKARAGLLDDDALQNAQTLECEAFRVLANYCEARAFVQSEDGL
jgi:hypothetical protein